MPCWVPQRVPRVFCTTRLLGCDRPGPADRAQAEPATLYSGLQQARRGQGAALLAAATFFSMSVAPKHCRCVVEGKRRGGSSARRRKVAAASLGGWGHQLVPGAH